MSDCVPRCSVCTEMLGAHGGPCTLPCGAFFGKRSNGAAQHARRCEVLHRRNSFVSLLRHRRPYITCTCRFRQLNSSAPASGCATPQLLSAKLRIYSRSPHRVRNVICSVLLTAQFHSAVASSNSQRRSCEALAAWSCEQRMLRRDAPGLIKRELANTHMRLRLRSRITACPRDSVHHRGVLRLTSCTASRVLASPHSLSITMQVTTAASTA